MELYPLTVVLIRTQADGGVPCNLGFGGLCQAILGRPNISQKAEWEILSTNPCETHNGEYLSLIRSNSEQAPSGLPSGSNAVTK